LKRGDTTLARAEFESLPVEVPIDPDPDDRASRPFTLFLGSCFHVDGANNQNVGVAYDKIFQKVSHRPHMKLLCGDQVYLDAPPESFLLNPSKGYLRHRFVETYRKTWLHREQTGKPGFQELLGRVGTLFLSDDHEFWNNYPNRPSNMRVAWSSEVRRDIEEIALDLFRGVQTERTHYQFRVSPLSFFVADTRIARSEAPAPNPASLLNNNFKGGAQFMRNTDMEALKDWASDLNGPGVLVLGQPILAQRDPFRGLRGRYFDFNLPDFEQYATLVTTLHECEHDILLLTGDVHFGSVASCNLNQVRGTKLIQITSSPMALVHPIAGNGASLPSEFPDSDISGVSPEPIEIHETVQERPSPGSRDAVKTAEHFMTVAFSRTASDPSSVKMRVRAWLVDAPSGPDLPVQDFEVELTLR
jgi:hypothetical protein